MRCRPCCGSTSDTSSQASDRGWSGPTRPDIIDLRSLRLSKYQPSAGPTGHFVKLSPVVRLSRIDEELFIARLDPGNPVPFEMFAAGATILSVTRTSLELSIVCPRSHIPEGAEVDGPWCAWYVNGPIPFGLTGVIEAVVSPLSARSIPVFVVSTFDSDIIMAPAAHAAYAATALRDAGHELI